MNAVFSIFLRGNRFPTIVVMQFNGRYGLKDFVIA